MTTTIEDEEQYVGCKRHPRGKRYENIGPLVEQDEQRLKPAYNAGYLNGYYDGREKAYKEGYDDGRADLREELGLTTTADEEANN